MLQLIVFNENKKKAILKPLWFLTNRETNIGFLFDLTSTSAIHDIHVYIPSMSWLYSTEQNSPNHTLSNPFLYRRYQSTKCIELLTNRFLYFV
jgi:hypothetical protein